MSQVTFIIQDSILQSKGAKTRTHEKRPRSTSSQCSSSIMFRRTYPTRGNSCKRKVSLKQKCASDLLLISCEIKTEREEGKRLQKQSRGKLENCERKASLQIQKHLRLNIYRNIADKPIIRQKARTMKTQSTLLESQMTQTMTLPKIVQHILDATVRITF